MKALNDSIPHPRDGLASSFSVTEKCPFFSARERAMNWGRRAQLNRYPDLGLASLPPSRPALANQWLGGSLYPFTVAQPSPIFTGFPVA